MNRRDIMFYLAVFVALTTSAATAANVQTIAGLREEIASQQLQIDALENGYAMADSERVMWRDEAESFQQELALWEMQASLDQMIKEKNAAYDAPAWMQAGEFRIYHYCPCEKCTSKKPGDRDYGITATGAEAAEGRTVAVDPDIIPLGSEVLINGVVYIAEDTGVKGKAIDIFVGNHEQALAMGTYVAAVSWR